jgi:hypothetical protein
LHKHRQAQAQAQAGDPVNGYSRPRQQRNRKKKSHNVVVGLPVSVVPVLAYGCMCVYAGSGALYIGTGQGLDVLDTVGIPLPPLPVQIPLKDGLHLLARPLERRHTLVQAPG